jgi:hypothetical protein
MFQVFQMIGTHMLTMALADKYVAAGDLVG